MLSTPFLTMPVNIEDTLDETERIVAILANEGVQSIIIGAIALAVHQYDRLTKDVDLGVNISVNQMEELLELLVEQGYEAKLHLTDPEYPLGGVIDIPGPFGLVRIMNFGERFPDAIQDALAAEPIRIWEKSELQVIPIPQLVALKLYAGGWKALSDVVELLKSNPDENLDVIGEICRNYGLRGWSKVMEELRAS